MDTLHNLRMFVEAVRSESLSAGARKLGVSTATVSRGIDALEKHLGFQLLMKTSRSIGLTEAGQAYYPEVEELLRHFDDATEMARGFQCSAEGILRVRARFAVGNIWIAPLIPEFLSLYPKVHVHLSFTSLLNADLVSDNIDVDIRTGVLRDSSLTAKKLADSRRIIVSSRAYLEEHGVPRHPTDLGAHNCIVYQPDRNPVFWRFRDSLGVESTLRPNGNFSADNGGTIRTALRAGLGIAQMTDWSVAADLLSGRLVRILEDYDVTTDAFNHGIYAVFLKNRTQSVKVRAFIDYLTMSFKKHKWSLDVDRAETIVHQTPGLQFDGSEVTH
jgi:DNA-binding transcriptional LysR family regulator